MPDRPVTSAPAAPGDALASTQPGGDRRGRAFFFRWPFLAVTALLLLLVGSMVGQAMARTGGKWVYPIDDAYIHMAIVKHFVQHGVWGVSHLNGFSSSESSLLYPLLIAIGFLLFGVNDLWLLALNLIAAVAAIYYAGSILRRHTRSGALIFAVLTCAVCFTPLFAVVTTGMEHVWQILIDLFFADLASRVLASEAPASTSPRARWLLPLAAFLAVMIRFEGLFFVMIVGLLLLCRGRFWLAVGIGAAAALPLGLFGAYSVWKGWYFLPNSVLLKGGTHSTGLLFMAPVAVAVAALWWPRLVLRGVLAGVILAALAALFPHPRAWLWGKAAVYQGQYRIFGHLAIVLVMQNVALFWQWQRRRTLWTPPILLLCIVLVVTIQHIAFAAVGWVFRYEAYLMFLGLLAVGVAFADASPAPADAWLRRAPGSGTVAWAGAAAACLLLALRAFDAYLYIPYASRNIYEQQYQMARFVQRFYDGAGVAANDIGALDYYADLRIVDTWGLAELEVCEARRKHVYNQDVLRRVLRKYDVQLVLVYDSWAEDYGGILPEWKLVGRWKISDNVVCGSDTVSFYAPDAGAVLRLTRALREFASELPPDVLQTGAYTAARDNRDG